MNKNQQCVIKIEDIGANGEGIGRFEGYTLFVKDAVVGDLAKVKVIKAKKNYGYGRLEEIIEPSPFRVEPVCPHHRRCGGCQLQAMSYEKQLEWKVNKVRNNLERIGGLPQVPIKDVIGMEEPYRYRNKAQYPVGWRADKDSVVKNGKGSIRKNKVDCKQESMAAATAREVAGTDRIEKKAADGIIVAGFYAEHSHIIIDSEECYLGHPVNGEILRKVKAYIEKCHVEPYDEQTGKGLVRHVLIREGFRTGEIMVCLIANGNRLPKENVLISSLREISGVVSIMLNVNREKTNVILGTELRTLWGKDHITDYIGNVKFSISPLSFFQVNPVQTEKLYAKVTEYAGLEEQARQVEGVGQLNQARQKIVWDLYCGIGSISLFLAQKARQVYGVEIVPAAVEDARKNAAANGIMNAEFFVGKAEDVVPKWVAAQQSSMQQYSAQQNGMEQGNVRQAAEQDVTIGQAEGKNLVDVVVVDPPRKGCDQTLLDTLVLISPPRIVYVSCDSATLARDLKYLGERGYEVTEVTVCDMFPQTVHVETVCLLSKLHSKHHIEVELHMDEMDLTAAESKATYEEIKAYVLEHSGLNVSNLYIAQAKQKYGIIERECYNKPKSEDSRQPKCPPEKEAAITEALKYFKMI